MQATHIHFIDLYTIHTVDLYTYLMSIVLLKCHLLNVNQLFGRNKNRNKWDNVVIVNIRLTNEDEKLKPD